MSLLNTITKALPFKVVRKPEKKEQNSSFGAYGWLNPYLNYGLGDRSKQSKPTWTTYYQAMDNEWVAACIDAYVIDALSAGFDVYSDNKEKDDPEVINYVKDLFQRPDGPDGHDTYTKFVSRGLSSLLGTGDWFAEVSYDDNIKGLPDGFYFIQPHRMTYHYDTDQWGIVGSNYRYENDEIIHVMLPDPWNELYGKSPIDKVARDITLDILSMNFNKEWFEKGISPKNFLFLDREVSSDDYKKVITNLKLQKEENPQGTYVVQGGTDFKDASMTNRDMQFSELQDRIRNRIVAGYGVPPQNVGIYTAGSLGNERDNTADKKFKKRLYGKILGPVEDEFNRVIGKSFDLFGFDERFHFGDIDLEDKLQKTNINNIRLRNGSLLVNEDRATWGLDPVPYGDEPLSYAMGSTGYGSSIQQEPAKEPTKAINRDVMALDRLLVRKGLVQSF